MAANKRAHLIELFDEQKVNQLFQTNVRHGLASEKAARSLRRDGQNILYSPEQMSFWRVFVSEIGEPMQLLLVAVGVGYAIWGELLDSIIVFMIIVLMIIVEIVNEFRAKRAVQLLSQKIPRQSLVMRDGRILTVQNTDIVVGDVLVLRAGEVVPADARLIESYSLQVNEMALTGESVPVYKDPLASVSSVDNAGECMNAVFATTTVLRGRATAVVYATGRDTEIGSVFSLAKSASGNKKKTNLQKAMKSLAKYLTIAAVLMSIAIPILGLIRKRPFGKMMLAGLSLAFCLIPEELPILIKSVLAIGSLQLSKVNILIKDLHAAETLGTVTYILTDKTGTLTHERLRLSKYVLGADSIDENHNQTAKDALLTNWMLSSDFSSKNIVEYIQSGRIDIPLSIPFDSAILCAIQNDPDLRTILQTCATILEQSTIEQELPFDSYLKYSTKIYKMNDSTRVEIIRGASDYVLEKCSFVYCSPSLAMNIDTELKQKLVEQINNAAKEGLRTVAVATKMVGEEIVENNYQFIGFYAFEEEIRSGTKEAIRKCRQAGIKMSIITGDHELTASRVARTIELGDSDELEVVSCRNLGNNLDDEIEHCSQNPTVFTRATPLAKYTICKYLQTKHAIAVTGDGVNDTAAISVADIGIAMGGGSNVCKEVAQVILLDDQFQTLVTGIQESRKLFANLCKSIQFYLGCKLTLVLLFVFAVVFNYEFPLTPIQTIVLELFMDIGASTTFTSERAESDIMKQKPRDPKQTFINQSFIIHILKGSLALFSCVWTCFLIGLHSYSDKNVTLGQTMAFAGWLFGHLMLALNSRTTTQPILFHGVLDNYLFLGWVGAAIFTLIAVLYVPFLRRVMGTTQLGFTQWMIVIAISIVSTVWIEAIKILMYFWDMFGGRRRGYELLV